jgi:hypothetical protein
MAASRARAAIARQWSCSGVEAWAADADAINGDMEARIETVILPASGFPSTPQDSASIQE